MRWTSDIRYRDLQVGDLLFDTNGCLYEVVEMTEPAFSLMYNDVMVDRFRIVSLLNKNTASGNARASSRVSGFDYPWVWHSRLGCLIL